MTNQPSPGQASPGQPSPGQPSPGPPSPGPPSPDQVFTDRDLTILAGQARRASDILKALSHETRLLILWLLSENEKSVSELEEILALPQAAVSQQLARLRLDHLVSTRRDGRVIHYSIANPEISAVVISLYKLLCGPADRDS